MIDGVLNTRMTSEKNSGIYLQQPGNLHMISEGRDVKKLKSLFPYETGM